MVIRQPQQPIGHFLIFGIPFGFVAVARFADLKYLAGQPNRNAL
jgi:hypothetical protein